MEQCGPLELCADHLRGPVTGRRLRELNSFHYDPILIQGDGIEPPENSDAPLISRVRRKATESLVDAEVLDQSDEPPTDMLHVQHVRQTRPHRVDARDTAKILRDERVNVADGLSQTTACLEHVIGFDRRQQRRPSEAHFESHLEQVSAELHLHPEARQIGRHAPLDGHPLFMRTLSFLPGYEFLQLRIAREIDLVDVPVVIAHNDRAVGSCANASFIDRQVYHRPVDFERRLPRLGGFGKRDSP